MVEGGHLAKIAGFTQGLKASEQRGLERLYRRRVDREVTASPDLVRELSQLSAQLGRRLGLLINRGGQVTHVFLGDHTGIELPALSPSRRAEGRLKGLRWLCTTLSEGCDPSEDDLNALVHNRLDLLLLVGVNRTQPEQPRLREVHLVPAQEDGTQGYELGALHDATQLRGDLLVFLQEQEAAFEAATPAARATTGDEEGLTPALLAVVTRGRGGRSRSEQLGELRELAAAAGLAIKGELVQRRDPPDPHTLLGSGKVADLASLALTTGAEVVVFNEELAPRQSVALEDRLGLRVIDRTELILDVFAQRARTHAGKLQVEVARLRYMMPRLLGRGAALSRVGGGKGAGFARTKGKGEKKLEVDRRRIRNRIQALEAELKQVRRQRRTRRQRRHRNRLPHVALVGYTNVGKSTLFNYLTDSEVLVADKMFASLDPTVRHRVLPSGRRVLFSDSVGFIRHLPKDLLEAFGATLDELEDATVLLHVADADDPQALERVEAVRRILADIDHGQRPELLVFNKRDRVADPALFLPLARTMAEGEPILISARDGELGDLLERVEALLARVAPDQSCSESSDEISAEELPTV
jgi:GTPase